MNRVTYSIGSLFSGIGGWEFAAPWATPAWAVEKEVSVARAYQRNHGVSPFVADLRTVSTSALSPVDVLVASPPCPDYSDALREDAKPRDPEIAKLGLDVLRFVQALRPRFVAVENGRHYLKSEVGQAVVAGLRALGYAVEAAVLDASDWGCPQKRNRTIIRAGRNGRTPWPLPVVQRQSWWEAIGDRAAELPSKPLAPWQARNLALVPAPSFPVLVSGGNPPAWQDGSGGRRVWTLADEPAPTIARSKASSGTRVMLSPTDVRGLDLSALAALSGFEPGRLWLPEGRTEAINLLGNTIPPPLAAAALQGAQYA